MRMILSPVGTSILTNSENNRDLITRYSNIRDCANIPPDDLERIREHILNVRNTLMKADLDAAARLSAELHGIISYHQGNLQASSDHHYLIPSDTYIGKETAAIIKEFLEQYFIVIYLEVKGLQTDDIDRFQESLADLAKEIISILEVENYYSKVVFNLTGGFKAVQGFLLTLGMYYADESIYIFERSSHLMRIPKLPVKITADKLILNNLPVFRRLDKGLEISRNDIEAIPETLLLRCDDICLLSGWGQIVWNKLRKEIYRTKVYPPPSNLIKYSNKFERTVSNLETSLIYDLNVQFDELARYLEGDQKHCLKSLSFKQINKTAEYPNSTHEFYACSDKDAKRVFCHFESNILILDELGDHLR